MKKIRVGVLFGSRSVEHEVSIVTAMEIFAAMDRKKYEVTPIYIDKKGKWNIGKDLDKLESYFNLELKNKIKLTEYKIPVAVGEMRDLDIIFPAVHGAYGEDGTLQGLLEMIGIPYVGCGVTAAAVGMDKVLQKAVFEKANLPIVKYDWFMDWEYNADREIIIKRLEKTVRYPMCVKPANLGSSIGITIVKNREELEKAIQLAKEFDRKILIEEALMGIDEINCAVMGVDSLEVSVCEQPIKGDKLLSYEDKYLTGNKNKGMAGMIDIIPAPINERLTKKIQEYAKMAFRVIGASGVSRIDFLVNIRKEKVYINEINTMPGGVSFYLWDKSGYSYMEIVDKLIEMGFERFNKMAKLQRSFETKLLKSAKGGTKFLKD
jgi:D-alanine-D-alanine ligase